jgi:hypothetical protein
MEASQVQMSNLKAQTDLVDANFRVQRTNNDQMLRQLREANDGIAATRDEARTADSRWTQQNRTVTDALSRAHSTAVLHHKDMQATLHQRTTKISDQVRDVSHQNTALLQTLRTSQNTWNQHNLRTSAQLEGSQRSLDNITATVAEMRTTTTFSATNIQMMTDIMRREMLSTLGPVVEQAFTTSANRNEAMLNRLSDVIRSITSEVGRGVYKMNSDDDEKYRSRGQENDRLKHYFNTKELKIGSRARHLGGRPCNPANPQFWYMTSKYRRSWTFRWKIGVLTMSLYTTTGRISGSLEREIQTEITFRFMPSQVLMQLPGVEMLHRIGPDVRGFHQIAPAICVFSVVSREHPIFDAIWDGDLVQVQELLATGKNMLRIQTGDGITLLHVSQFLSIYQSSYFLLQEHCAYKIETSSKSGRLRSNICS